MDQKYLMSSQNNLGYQRTASDANANQDRSFNGIRERKLQQKFSMGKPQQDQNAGSYLNYVAPNSINRVFSQERVTAEQDFLSQQLTKRDQANSKQFGQMINQNQLAMLVDQNKLSTKQRRPINNHYTQDGTKTIGGKYMVLQQWTDGQSYQMVQPQTEQYQRTVLGMQQSNLQAPRPINQQQLQQHLDDLSSVQKLWSRADLSPQARTTLLPRAQESDSEDEDLSAKKAAALVNKLISMPLSLQAKEQANIRPPRTDPTSKIPSKLKLYKAENGLMSIHEKGAGQKIGQACTLDIALMNMQRSQHNQMRGRVMTKPSETGQQIMQIMSADQSGQPSSRINQKQGAQDYNCFVNSSDRVIESSRINAGRLAGEIQNLPNIPLSSNAAHREKYSVGRNNKMRLSQNIQKLSQEKLNKVQQERQSSLHQVNYPDGWRHESARHTTGHSPSQKQLRNPKLPEIQSSSEKLLTLNDFKGRTGENKTTLMQIQADDQHLSLQAITQASKLRDQNSNFMSQLASTKSHQGLGSRNKRKPDQRYEDKISKINSDGLVSEKDTKLFDFNPHSKAKQQIQSPEILTRAAQQPYCVSQIASQVASRGKKSTSVAQVKPRQQTVMKQLQLKKSQVVPVRLASAKKESDSECEPEQTIQQIETQYKVQTAHAELLDFFANCSDNEDSKDQHNLHAENHERRNTHDFLRKNKQTNEKDRAFDLNAKRRQAYASNSGVSSFLERVNSYKLLTQNIGKDENGNEIGPSLQEFRIQRNVGSGAYAVVKLASHELTKKRVALKIYSASQNMAPVKRKAIWQEIQCMKILKSEFFPKLYSDFEQPSEDAIVLVQEFVSGQSLFQVIKSKGQKSGLGEETARFYFKQIIEAVRFMHSNLICHRDLKLENILVSDRQKVKIIDFGFGIRTPSDVMLKIYCGTSSYMSPEIVRKQDYSGFKADIWALGVVLYVMLTGRFPFKAKTEKELFGRIQMGQFLPPMQINFDAKRLLTRMLSLEPTKRPTASEILRDPWMQQGVQINAKSLNTNSVPSANLR